MARRKPRKRPYSETQIFRDATMCLQKVARMVVNLPRPIQYSIGESALKDNLRIVQLMKLCYEAKTSFKLMYADEAKERLQCLEVTVGMLFECRYISENKLYEMYLDIGSMQKQLRGWREKISQNKEENEN